MLSVIKGVDYLIPLVLIPYGIYFIGLESYGVFAFYQTLAMFFSFCIDLGFSILGIQRIALSRSGRFSSQYISSALAIKILLAVVLLPVYFFASYSVPLYKDEYEGVVWSCFLIFLSTVLSYSWYFQALHLYRFLIVCSVVTRFSALLGVFVFVNDSDDFYKYCLIFSAMYFLPGFFQFLFVMRKRFLVTPSLRMMRAVAKSNLDVSLYRVVNALVLPAHIYSLGFLASPIIMAQVALVQRVLGVLINFSTPLMQALIPYYAKIKKSDKGKAVEVFIRDKKKVMLLGGGGGLGAVAILICFLIFVFYDLDGVYGWMVSSLMLSTVGCHVVNSFLTQGATLFGESVVIRKVVFYVTTLSVLFLLLVVWKGRWEWVVMSYVLTYFVMTIMLLLILTKKRLES